MARKATPSCDSHVISEGDPNYDGPPPKRAGPPCGTAGAPLRLPVIQTMTDYLGRDCFGVWCACTNDLVSPPYLDLDYAKVAAWDHAFPRQVSDMRITDLSANGNGRPKRRSARYDLKPCPHCGWEMRGSNLRRHIKARHATETGRR
jgi:hypothetical protein